ncbi:hypothetical protein GR160_06785 [Flavobacterium sp. Sd200]|uniref:uracil-DNA glycosylase family protein n=1 Tax=Flavobacterium sp. Sd200 TaxID=2692211 RepID=UPI00136EFC7E|nr:uracil-DNA glycosylase family protein [Flavobacterium sp. Sd200]MXN90930.1 hypothetical protein [Flavobacterium sp. Sd200]
MNYIKNLQREIIKNSYEKADLQTKKYSFGTEKNIEIFYAPFDYINPNAKIIIVGITPGWSQMEKSYRTAITSFSINQNWEEATKEVKKQASFAGSMRNNLITMLDELELNNKLNILSTSQLFDEQNSILHTTSIIKYPTFNKGKNYTGRTPLPLRTEILKNFIESNFLPEINNFENKLVIPLGTCVSKVLTKLNEDNLLNSNIYLNHFPHPSGSNGHRHKQFKDYKLQMFNQIKSWEIDN